MIDVKKIIDENREKIVVYTNKLIELDKKDQELSYNILLSNYSKSILLDQMKKKDKERINYHKQLKYMSTYGDEDLSKISKKGKKCYQEITVDSLVYDSKKYGIHKDQLERQLFNSLKNDVEKRNFIDKDENTKMSNFLIGNKDELIKSLRSSQKSKLSSKSNKSNKSNKLKKSNNSNKYINTILKLENFEFNLIHDNNELIKSKNFEKCQVDTFYLLDSRSESKKKSKSNTKSNFNKHQDLIKLRNDNLNKDKVISNEKFKLLKESVIKSAKQIINDLAKKSNKRKENGLKYKNENDRNRVKLIIKNENLNNQIDIDKDIKQINIVEENDKTINCKNDKILKELVSSETDKIEKLDKKENDIEKDVSNQMKKSKTKSRSKSNKLKLSTKYRKLPGEKINVKIRVYKDKFDRVNLHEYFKNSWKPKTNLKKGISKSNSRTKPKS